jgi:hypothetical protein
VRGWTGCFGRRAALRERSDALAKEAERLRVEIQKEQASRDRRKKPRVKGK